MSPLSISQRSVSSFQFKACPADFRKSVSISRRIDRERGGNARTDWTIHQERGQSQFY